MSKFHMIARRMRKVRMGLLGSCDQKRETGFAPYWLIDLSQRHQTCRYFQPKHLSVCRSYYLVLIWENKDLKGVHSHYCSDNQSNQNIHKNYTNPPTYKSCHCFMFPRGHHFWLLHQVCEPLRLESMPWNWRNWLRSSNEINYQTEKQGIPWGEKIENNFGPENPWESRAG